MRLPQINQGQHHEDERLKRNDEDVENGPHRAGNQMADKK
jgi:hypothetical protein